MRPCPYCGKEYPDDATICTIDGESLIPQLPPLPVNAEQKEWIEASLQWLINEFGADFLLKHPVILPDASFFPDKYNGTEKCALKVVSRVCSYMDIDSATVEVEFFSDEDDEIRSKYHLMGGSDYSGAAGLYFLTPSQQMTKKIAINTSQLKNPFGLVATIAHELGHVILLGGGKISPDDDRHEFLTDLLTVFFGLGIFTANSVFQFSQWQSHSHHGWRASRTGYMSEEMFAYSLAACVWMRSETNPKWSKYLAMNVGHYFKESLKYFEKGSPTSLRPFKN